MKLKIEYKWKLTPESLGQFITKNDAQATKVRLQRKLKDKKLVTKLPKTGNKRVTKCVEIKKKSTFRRYADVSYTCMYHTRK